MADETAYDIIIIGAGTTGCVLANRLSEDPSISVLVLEAGQNRNQDERVYTPGLAVSMQQDDEYDWRYESTPQPAINGRTIKHPRGRMVGGTSAINSFALIYPSKAGLDVWEELGNEGWGWKGMKEYYRKFQTVCPPSDDFAAKVGIAKRSEIPPNNGPIQASHPSTFRPGHKAWVETFRNLHLENTADPLDGDALGGHISTCHVSSDRLERSHAGVAYLQPVLNRDNLHIVSDALTEKLIFDDPSNGKATHVRYNKDGTTHTVRIRKEVILAAGTFGSPQLLELSGIGDAQRLRKLDVPLVHANSSVGENLQDHMRTGISLEALHGSEVLPADQARKLYQESRGGPWGTNTCFTFAYLPLTKFLSAREEEELTAVIDKYLSASNVSSFERQRNDFIRRMTLSANEATSVAYLASKPAAPDDNGRNWLSIFAMLSHPFSRGSTHISSSKADVKPEIDFGYYTHPLDLEIHARHMQSLNKIFSTPPLSTMLKPNSHHLPEDADAATLVRAKELVKGHATTNYHPCGTCSMMPEAMGGVVDARLRVYGTRNVRVVDASVIPVIPRGNIITTVYALAEKGADVVSEDLGLRRTT